MPMLDASDPAFSAIYPSGALVFDAHGRQLRHVLACVPLTGEVVMADLRMAFWLRIPGLSSFYARWRRWGSYLPRRHGFWPAPLRIVPITP